MDEDLQQSLHQAFEILSTQGYAPTDNSYARDKYTLSKIFYGNERSPRSYSTREFGAFSKEIDKGHVHFVVFVADEDRPDVIQVAGLFSTTSYAKKNISNPEKVQSVELEDFLEEIGTEQATLYFASLEQRAAYPLYRKMLSIPKLIK